MKRIIELWLLVLIICSITFVRPSVSDTIIPIQPVQIPAINLTNYNYTDLAFEKPIITPIGIANGVYDPTDVDTRRVWMFAVGNDTENSEVEILFKSASFQLGEDPQGRGRHAGPKDTKIIGKMEASLPPDGVVQENGGEIKVILKIMKVNNLPGPPDSDIEIQTMELINPQPETNKVFVLQTNDLQPAGTYYLLGGFKLSANKNTNAMVALIGGKYFNTSAVGFPLLKLVQVKKFAFATISDR